MSLRGRQVCSQLVNPPVSLAVERRQAAGSIRNWGARGPGPQDIDNHSSRHLIRDLRYHGNPPGSELEPRRKGAPLLLRSAWAACKSLILRVRLWLPGLSRGSRQGFSARVELLSVSITSRTSCPA